MDKLPWKCTFDRDDAHFWCGFTQDVEDDMDWIEGFHSSGTPNTGPPESEYGTHGTTADV